MLQVEPMASSINGELEQVIKRLEGLRESFTGLADKFGVPLPEQKHAHPNRDPENPQSTGLSELRTAITEINIQIYKLEQERDRLFLAQVELFGVGDDEWHETDVSIDAPPHTPGNYGPVRPGDFRTP